MAPDQLLLSLTDGVVVLRDWTAADADELARWLGAGHECRKTNAPYLPPPSAVRQQEALEELRSRVGDPRLPTPRESLVIGGTDGSFLGEVSWYWESRETDWRRLGIALYDPLVWRGGLGSRAFALWTSYMFSNTKVPRLDFATWSGNLGMLRIGQRLGFVEEGRFRQAREVDGVLYDAVVMGTCVKNGRLHSRLATD